MNLPVNGLSLLLLSGCSLKVTVETCYPYSARGATAAAALTRRAALSAAAALTRRAALSAAAALNVGHGGGCSVTGSISIEIMEIDPKNKRPDCLAGEVKSS